MVTVKCIDCNETFEREDKDTWKTRCISCWKKANGYDITDQLIKEQAAEIINLRREMFKLRHELESKRLSAPQDDGELLKHMRFLLLAVHPDRHGLRHQKEAHEVTRWLLSLRANQR